LASVFRATAYSHGSGVDGTSSIRLQTHHEHIRYNVLDEIRVRAPPHDSTGPR
jgi:hypothetical protein